MEILSKTLTKKYVLPFIQKIVKESFKEHFDRLVIKHSSNTPEVDKLNRVLQEIEVICLVSCHCSITRELSEVTIFDLDKRGNPFYKVMRDVFKCFKENFIFVDHVMECIENEFVDRKKSLYESGIISKEQSLN